MNPYKYEKDFDINGDALSDVIKLNKVVWPLIDRIDIQGQRSIEIYTKELLLNDQEDELISIINSFTVDCPMMIRKYLKDSVMAQAMNFGADLLEEIAASNIYLGKTEAQYYSFLESYVVLIHSLQTGSLNTAYKEFCTIEPGDDFGLDELEEFRRRIEIFLGIE